MIKTPQDHSVIEKLDIHLKRICASGILENLQKQAKQNQNVAITYIPGNSLRVMY